MNASKLVVSNIGRSVGSATTLLLSGSSLDDDSGDSSSRQRLLRGGVFDQLVSLRKRGELKVESIFCYNFRLFVDSRQSFQDVQAFG